MLVVQRTPGFCSLAQSGWHCDAAVRSTDFLLEPLPSTYVLRIHAVQNSNNNTLAA